MDPADERLADWYTWFKENVHRGRDLNNEVKFLHTALEGLMECMIILRAQQRKRLPENSFLGQSPLIHTR